MMNTHKCLTLFILIVFFAFSLEAQRTITGKVIYEDGEPQIAASFIAYDAHKETLKVKYKDEFIPYTDYEGNYEIRISEETSYLCLMYEGTFNETFPVPTDSVLNIINANYDPSPFSLEYRYQPKEIEYGSKREYPILVRGIVRPYINVRKRRKKWEKKNIEINDLQIVNVASDGTVLQSTQINELGHFSMTIPPGSDILKIQYQERAPYYFNIGTTPSVFIPMRVQ